MIAHAQFEGLRTTFNIINENDHIQAVHNRGQFYELSQLIAHRNVIPMHSLVLDIGANVGNHTLFYARYTRAKRTYPFEPNPAARSILIQNLISNPDRAQKIDLRYVDLALGRDDSTLRVVSSPENNIGATRFARDGISRSSLDDQDIRCARLDSLDFADRVGFMKIDVEGMEIEVLTGATGLIEAQRPTISVEVSSANELGFWTWINDNEYQIVSMFCEYIDVKTYLIVPRTVMKERQ